MAEPANTPANAPAPKNTPDVSMLVFPPIVHTVWGIILLAGFVLGMMMQVQSTEAWMLHADTANSIVPSLNLFLQFPRFFGGQMKADEIIAFLVAWGVELTYITIKIGTTRTSAHIMRKHGAGPVSEGMRKSAERRAGFWTLVSWAIVLFNSYTDWQYAAGLGGGQQVVFLIVIFVTTFYFGTLGVQNLVAGLSKMAA